MYVDTAKLNYKTVSKIITTYGNIKYKIFNNFTTFPKLCFYYINKYIK